MKRLLLMLAVFVSFLVVGIIFLGSIGIYPLIPGEWFLPRISDTEGLIYECRGLVSEWDKGTRLSPVLLPKDYPPEIARLEPQSVQVWEDEVIIRMWVRGHVVYGFIVRPKEGVVKTFSGGTYRGDV